MTDIRSLWPRGQSFADYTPAPGGGALDDRCDLATAVMISLFTHRRAEPSDVLPEDPRGLAGNVVLRANSDPRGWWADSLTGRRIGSRLWLLVREKSLASVRARAVAYAREALAWLIEDGLAAGVDIDAPDDRRDLLALAIRLRHPRHGALDLAVLWPWAGAAACAAASGEAAVPGAPRAILTFDSRHFDFSLTSLSWDARV